MTLPLKAKEVESPFFDRPVDAVALDLIGRRLRVTSDAGDVYATIIETEAYGDASDPASHAAFRPGGRAAIMAEEPGSVYVYSAYGMYPCFNIVTGSAGHASAVLLRGVLSEGDAKSIHGPGRTTRMLGIGPDDHGAKIPGKRFGISCTRKSFDVVRTPRIGISRAVDMRWRFIAEIDKD